MNDPDRYEFGGRDYMPRDLIPVRHSIHAGRDEVGFNPGPSTFGALDSPNTLANTTPDSIWNRLFPNSNPSGVVRHDAGAALGGAAMNPWAGLDSRNAGAGLATRENSGTTMDMGASGPGSAAFNAAKVVGGQVRSVISRYGWGSSFTPYT